MKTSLMNTMIMLVIGLMALAGCALSPKAVGSYTSEDNDAKNLTPAEGKALVYFFYGRSSSSNLDISLDGAKTPINGQMYAVWEIPAGTHTLEVIVPGASDWETKTAKTSVDASAGSIQYYRVISYAKEESAAVKEMLYQLSPIGNSDGKEYVQAFALISRFRDGERIYYNEALLQ